MNTGNRQMKPGAQCWSSPRTQTIGTGCFLWLLWTLVLPTLGVAEQVETGRAQIDTRSWNASQVVAEQPQVDAGAARAATVQALVSERQYWLSRYTALGAPLALTLLGIGGLAVGIPLAVDGKIQKDKECGDWGCIGDAARARNDAERKAGLGLSIGGAIVFTVGVILFSVRTSKARQTYELNRIDRRLRGLGAQASLSPWFNRRESATQGWAGGLTASVRF